jgi:CDP-diacylglycerol pyrophosphatase
MAGSGYTPPSDCGNDDDHSSRDQLWVDAKKTPDPLHHGYVVFGGSVMGFKGAYNGLLVPKTRITGIECPKVVDPHAQNYWPSAWEKAKGLNLREPKILVSVNSMDGRTQDQLHFHLTVLKSDVRAQLDNLDTTKLGIGTWNSNLYILATTDEQGKDDSYVYRIAHVDDIDTNPFILLNDHVATQKDSHGNTFNDRFAQSLAIVKGTKGAGFFLIATQGQPSHGAPQHLPDLDLKDKTGKHIYGAKTVEALIDRDWKPI